MTQDSYVFFDGLARGVYIYNVLVAAILLYTNLFGRFPHPQTAIKRVLATRYLLKGIAVFLSFFGRQLFYFEGLQYLGRFTELVASMLTVAFGVMLYTGLNRLSTKWLIAIVVPYSALMAISFFTPPRSMTMLQVSTLIFLCYEFCIAGLLFRREGKLKLFYADTEHRTAKWYIVAIFMTAADLILVIYTRMIGWEWSVITFYLILSMIDLYICIQMIFQIVVPSRVIDSIDEAITETEDGESYMDASEMQVADSMQDSNEGTASSSHSPLGLKLLELMERDQIFTDPHLTVEKVTIKLDTSATYFYRILRLEFHATFFDFVNLYRVEKAKKMLEDKSVRVADVAFECGFNSPQSFNRTFRRMTGLNPTEYRGM